MTGEVNIIIIITIKKQKLHITKYNYKLRIHVQHEGLIFLNLKMLLTAPHKMS